MSNSGVATMDSEKGKNFNEYSSKYMCCCHNVHVKTGTLIIAILAAIGLVFNFGFSFVSKPYGTTNLASSIGSSIGSLIIGGAAVACVFYALHSQRAAFLIPYIALQILGIVVFIGLIILCIVALAGVEFPQTVLKQIMGPKTDDIDVKMFAAALIVIFVIEILFTLWFLWVICKCFIFFRDQANYALNNTTSVGYIIHSNVEPITVKRQI